MLSVVATDAQRRNAGANNGVPVATAALLGNPGAYYGKVITVSAGIEQVVSKTAFVVDQRKMASPTAVQAIGKPVLVIAPELSSVPDAKHYVMVKGQIVRFEPAEIEKAVPGYRLDLPADVRERFIGQPVLIANSVLNSVYKEIGRRPLMPEELALSKAMKAISPASTALRTAAQQSKPEAISTSVAALVPAFSEAEKIWDNLGASAAAEWSRQARQHAIDLESAAATGNWEAAKDAFGALNQACAGCHATYREALDDGTYRIKRGTI
jgi:cytochrome c556